MRSWSVRTAPHGLEAVAGLPVHNRTFAALQFDGPPVQPPMLRTTTLFRHQPLEFGDGNGVAACAQPHHDRVTTPDIRDRWYISSRLCTFEMWNSMIGPGNSFSASMIAME